MGEQEKKSKKRKKEGKHKDRREERKRLKAQVPLVDEHGISYTKQQVRQMMKRVKRGLDPVPSKEEQQEMEQAKRQEKKEIEAMLYPRDDDDEEEEEEEDHDNNQDESNDVSDADSNHSDDEIEQKEEKKGDENSKSDGQTESSLSPTKTKKKRSKEVPDDYVCQACQNKHKPPHWIYDCPDKEHRPGSNQVSKSQRGLHNPDARKVFCSGLPFTSTYKDVKEIFNDCTGKIVACKMLKFPDTGRCKGQAIVTFDTEEAAKQAISQKHGAVLPRPKAKPGSKELKLHVTRVLNRSLTKKEKSS